MSHNIIFQFNELQNLNVFGTRQNNQFIYKQVARAGFRGPLLICLLNLTLNEKSSSHTLQFALKYHVLLNSLQAQIWDHTHRYSGAVAIYYTVVGLEKK